MKKNYGLTTKPNEGVKDKAPDWMNSLFEKQTNGNKEEKKQIKTTLASSKTEIKCETCGVALKPTDVDICEACSEDK